jgi:hypothetical protein
MESFFFATWQKCHRFRYEFLRIFFPVGDQRVPSLICGKSVANLWHFCHTFFSVFFLKNNGDKLSPKKQYRTIIV